MRQAHIPQSAPLHTGDTELVRRALARDEAAVRAIMQANNRRLYRLARGILRNDGEAEDVVQEAYVRAFTHLESFRGDSSLSTWLSRIAMNEALGRLRRRRPAVELDALPQGALEAEIIQFPFSAAADPEKSMAQREIQAVVEHAIDELPAKGNACITTGPIFFSTMSRSILRARCSRLFTVSGLSERISAVSSTFIPSITRVMKTRRNASGNSSMACSTTA